MTTPRTERHSLIFKTVRAKLTFQLVLAASYVGSMAVLWSLYGPQAH